MRKLSTSICQSFLVLMVLSFAFPFLAQGANATEQQDSVAYKTSFHFAKDQYAWFEKMNGLEIFQLVTWVKNNDDAQVKIQGWADVYGTEGLNTRVSEGRAQTAKNYLVNEGIAADRITCETMGVDTETNAKDARRADLMAFIPVAKPATKPAATAQKPATPAQKPAAAPAPAEKKPAAPAQETAPVQETAAATAQESNTTAVAAASAATAAAATAASNEISLRTNLLYWVGGLANIGAEWNIGTSPVSIVLNGGYSPFDSHSWNHNFGGWFVSPEVRYYLGEKEQWFVGAEFMYGGYDLKLKEVGRTGKVTQGGIMGGYKLTLSKHFDMDFTLGLGYVVLDYDVYKFNEETDTRFDVFKDQYKGVLPMQAGVNLIWKLN